MKKNDQLFQLIKSLSKSEKRYFKLFAGINAKESTYMVLFDAIDKLAEYDEDEIRKKCHGQAFLKQLSVTKNYLFGMIIKALKNYEVKYESQQEKIEDDFQTARLLDRRNLLELRDKVLNKARKQIEASTLFLLKSRMAIFDWKEALHLPPGPMEVETRKNLSAARYALEQELEFLDMRSIWNEYAIKSTQSSVARTKEDVEVMEELLRKPILQEDTALKSIVTETMRVTTLSGINSYLGRYELSWQYEKKYIEHFINDESDYIEKKPYGSCILIRNYALACIDARKWNEVERWLSKLDELKPSTAESKSLYLNVKMEISMHYLLQSGQHQAALDFMHKEKKNLELSESTMQPTELTQIHLECAIAYFYTEDYSKALEVCNEVILDKRCLKIPKYQNIAKLIRLICYYELDLRNFVQQEIKAFYRNLKKQDKRLKFDFMILKLLKEASAVFSQKELIKVLLSYKEEIQFLKSDIYEREGFYFFDMEIWMDSKIEKISMPKIVQKYILAKTA